METDLIRTLSRNDKVVSSVGRHSAPCGYCRSESNTSVTCGMYVHRMSVDIYQSLVDCGWRRSGCWLYRPIPDETCCNPYPIRLDVHKFQPDKVCPLQEFASFPVSRLQRGRAGCNESELPFHSEACSVKGAWRVVSLNVYGCRGIDVH